jgi:hypothetical protein
MQSESKLIANSPIDFVVVGPVGGRDRVWVRNTTAGLDILGLSTAKSLDSELSDSSSSLFSVLFGPVRQLNVIETYPVDDIMAEHDDRRSSVRFAWAGYCSSMRQDWIKEAMNKAVNDLRKAIMVGDESEIELAIAPVIFRCTIANDRRLKSRRSMLVALGAYGIVGVAALLAMAVQSLIRVSNIPK